MTFVYRDTPSALLVTTYRGSQIESCHKGHIACVDSEGALLFSVGDPERLIFPRSALKPIQALAAIARDVDQRFALKQSEVAVTCGSHNAEPVHLQAVRSILEKVGAAESDLHCGAQEPPNTADRNELIREKREPTAIYNNCSGKHAGLLALGKVLGAPIHGYWGISHPVQAAVQGTLREHCGIDQSIELPWAVDGCAIPNYMLTVRQLAFAFAGLVRPRTAYSQVQACGRLSAAMMAEPHMVGGAGSRDTLLMTRFPQKILAKAGAEGVQALGLPEQGLGIAIKIDDGNARALGPVCLSILEQLNFERTHLTKDLQELLNPPIANTRGETVGFLRAEFRIP